MIWVRATDEHVLTWLFVTMTNRINKTLMHCTITEEQNYVFKSMKVVPFHEYSGATGNKKSEEISVSYGHFILQDI